MTDVIKEICIKQMKYYDALPIELRDMIKYHNRPLPTEQIWYLWMTGKPIEEIRNRYA